MAATGERGVGGGARWGRGGVPPAAVLRRVVHSSTSQLNLSVPLSATERRDPARFVPTKQKRGKLSRQVYECVKRLALGNEAGDALH